jgi:hypothetical protein
MKALELTSELAHHENWASLELGTAGFCPCAQNGSTPHGQSHRDAPEMGVACAVRGAY